MALQLNSYLTMDGNAREAIDFYIQALKAEVLFIQSFGEMPENPEFPLPEEVKERISHATLKVGDSVLMFSDSFPGNPPQKGSMLSICITTDGYAESERIFNALQEGGEVEMPLQQTFFSPGYAMVTDKFGVLFQIFTKSPQ